MSSGSSSALYNSSNNNNNERREGEGGIDNTNWKPFNNNHRRPSLLPHPSEIVPNNNDLFSYAFPATSSTMQQQQQQQQIAAATAPWSSTYNNISSVPMLPEVSEEPFYRTTRSMSYSFGHNNNTNPFSPTPSSYYLPDATQDTTFMQQQQENFLLEEEEEEEEREQADILRFMYIRTRSKSTAAVMVAPPPPHENDNNIWNPQKKELEDDAKWFAQHNKRRSSLVSSSNTVFPPMMSSSSSSTTTASSGIRRFSLAPSAAATASSYFDNNTTMSAATPMFLVGQRRHSLAGPTTIHHQQSSSLMMNSILEIEGLSIREKPAAAVNNMESSPPMTTTTSKTTKKMDEMGKGTRLDLLHGVYFYVVEFKAGRSDVFYSIQLYNKNELVIVEADRGRDLGKIAQQNIPRHQLEIYYAQLKSASHSNFEEEQQEEEAVKTIYQPNEIYVKNVFRMAKRDEITLFMTKVQDEAKALMVCQSKIKQKKLNMQVVDAEYQWDKRKLTFYFIAEKRVDFRELVRELFKLYKTRIWMCAMNSIKVLE